MGNTLSSVQEKGFHMYFGRFLVFLNSEDRFSHDTAHIISLFPCLKINITLILNLVLMHINRIKQ